MSPGIKNLGTTTYMHVMYSTVFFFGNISANCSLGMFLQDSSSTLTQGAYGKGSFVLHILYRIMSLCDTSLNGSLWVCLMELWKHLILGEEEREYNYFIFEG